MRRYPVRSILIKPPFPGVTTGETEGAVNEPTMLYKYPGTHEIHGDKFDYTIVDASEVDEELKNGWKKTTDEAKNTDDTDDTEVDDAEASREEMLDKAAEIGLEVDGRWSDKTLMEKITEALAALDELE